MNAKGKTWLIAALALGVCAGCSGLSAQLPGGGDNPRLFADVPPPPRSELISSYVYEAESHRYGTLLYKGRVDIDDIVREYKRLMPREDWVHAETLTSGETVLRYTKRQKPLEHCDIVIGKAGWTGSRYIIVTVTGARSE